MNGYLKLKKSNCKNCYKCIRHCPVKSIRFSENQAHIVEDACILCGQCFVNCPQNAKVIRCDLEPAKALLASGSPVYASIAPAFIANYTNISFASMQKALKQLGFAGVEETAIGATMVKKQYEALIQKAEQPVIISSCCPSVNELIQKYYPEALPYLAHVLSPMQAHCRSLKASHDSAKVIFIGPCIAKKAEAEHYAGDVDCVLTFEELSQWLAEKEIVLDTVSAVERMEESKARLFPTAGGILRTMNCTDSRYQYISIDGIENCIHAIKDIIQGNLANCFIEMSSCTGSCIGGPVMDRKHRLPIRDYIAVNHHAGTKDFSVAMPSPIEMEKKIPFLGIDLQMPSTHMIEEILQKMGKTKPEDELNCGSCGYDTCREKAVAVYLGKADLTMCLPFLKEKAESFSDTIINNSPNAIFVLNETLEIQQMNTAACEMMNVLNVREMIGEPVVRILDPQIFMDALCNGKETHDKRAYLEKYGKYVEQTALYDKSYHIVMGIMRDVTNEEKERSQKEEISRHTIEITDKVIEKQMRTVQEIASLLGETTAETKIALTKLKESLKK